MAHIGHISDIVPKEITNIIEARRNYLRARDLMNFHLDSYTGGAAYTPTKYLIQNKPNESNSDFIIRSLLSPFDNHCKRVVNNYVSNIFSVNPTRNNLESFIEILQFKD